MITIELGIIVTMLILDPPNIRHDYPNLNQVREERKTECKGGKDEEEGWREQRNMRIKRRGRE